MRATDQPPPTTRQSPDGSSVAGRAAEIADILTLEILRGEWDADSPLRQAPLAERFSVSRTPVREALYRLVALGLASFQPHAGFRVHGISRSEYLDAMLIRSRLEGLAAERATVRATAAQLSRVAKIVAELEVTGERVTASAGSRRVTAQTQWSRGNEEFHNLLVELAECPPLALAVSTTVRAYPRDVTWLAVESFPSVLTEYAEDHQGIYEAMHRSDAALARRRATEHVERALGYLRRVFDLDVDEPRRSGPR